MAWFCRVEKTPEKKPSTIGELLLSGKKLSGLSNKELLDLVNDCSIYSIFFQEIANEIIARIK